MKFYFGYLVIFCGLGLFIVGMVGIGLEETVKGIIGSLLIIICGVMVMFGGFVMADAEETLNEYYSSDKKENMK